MTSAPTPLLTMTDTEFRRYLRRWFDDLRARRYRRVPKDMLEALISPPGYWHDLDSPLVQDTLIEFQEDGLVTLAYYDHMYVYVNSEAEETPLVRVDVGRVARTKRDRDKPTGRVTRLPSR